MKVTAIVFILLWVTSTVVGSELPEPLQIIQEEGQFVFTDGSSYYLLKKDGTFTSEPLGISGREITGRWELQGRVFVIQGRWSWINGLSPRDDYRKMRLAIYRPVSSETVEHLSLVDGNVNTKIYKCYFVIEELQKIPKPEKSRSLSPNAP